MGALHWLILFPYYFFTAVSIYLVLVLGCRVVRASVSANPLAMAAVVGAVVLTVAPFVFANADIDDYGWQGLVVLLVVSFALALVDAVLEPSLGIAIDRELQDV